MSERAIIVYSLPECERCQKIKDILNTNGIEYTEVNNRDDMKKLGLESVPAISLDGQLIKEYNDIIAWAQQGKEPTVEEWLGQENQLGIDIWHKKYQRDNETFVEWLDRISGSNKDVKELILKKKFLFGGRILSNRGVPFDEEKTSYSNCYVIAPPSDNIESIYETCKKLARTYSYGGGCGIDISYLAPAGARVRNQAKNTSGAVSFMDTFSQVTEQIGQNGRRGALMISMRCDHPDIKKFITIKSDLNKVNYANISVMITDSFMEAVEANGDWKLSFVRPETNESIEEIVKAKDLFNLLCEQNWNYAEPGMLFWDRIENYNLLSNNPNFKYAGVNPCAEEPLPAGGSCLLGALNLAEFVSLGRFNYDDFKNAIRTSVGALNDVLDEGLLRHPLEEQRGTVRQWRQIGLGIMGLADCLIKLGVAYGSSESIEICDQIGSVLATTAIDESAKLAAQKGRYSEYTNDVLSSTFYQKHQNELLTNYIEKYGLRNSQLLTIAPTGTISTMLGVSGGIEPIFANSYTRTTKSLHGTDVQYKVYTPIVAEYMKANNIECEEDLPAYFVTSASISVDERVNMQGTWQQHIDASISSTVNLPEEATVEDVKRIYMQAWKKGLKGITVYRAGCARVAILSTTPTSNTDEKAQRGKLIDVPDNLTYRKYKLSTGCGKLYLFVGIDDNGNIYDVFTNTDGVGGCTVNTQANSRLLSACIRSGVSIEHIIEQLQKSGTCPSFQYARGQKRELSKGKSCPSAIANILKDILNEQHATSESKSKTHKETCPDCGAELIHENGCNACKNCGYSKCAV